MERGLLCTNLRSEKHLANNCFGHYQLVTENLLLVYAGTYHHYTAMFCPHNFFYSISLSDLINIFNNQVTVPIELPLNKYLDVEETAN